MFNPRKYKPKKVTRRHKGGGGGSIGPLTPTFNTVYQIDLIFGTYNEISLYFQLIETTWCLLGFHGNHSHINDITSGRHFGFSNFQTFFILELNTENREKTTLSDWNLQSCQYFFTFFSENSHLFSKKLNFRSQHKSCVTYYDDVINRDVT